MTLVHSGTASTTATTSTRPRHPFFDGLGPGIGPATSPEDVDEQLAVLVRHGATAAQFFANDWDVVLNGRVRAGRLARYRAVAERHAADLRYTLHAPIVELNLFEAGLPFQVTLFRAWLEVAAALGCRTMTYHPGRLDPEIHTHGALEDLHRREWDALARLAETGRALGVTIACENLHDPPWWSPLGRLSYSADPDHLLMLLADVGNPALGVCLDFGHLFLHSARTGADFLEGVHKLSPHAVVLHVHDNFGKPMDRQRPTVAGQFMLGEGDLHLPPGWGDVPLEAAFAQGDFRRRPICVMEVQARYWADDPDVLHETLASGRRLEAIAADAIGAAADRPRL